MANALPGEADLGPLAGGRYVYEGLWGYRRSREFYRLVYRWLVRVERDGDLRFAEKTPTNIFLIPFLAKAFPDSQFIHIIRDGRDAASSHMHKPWLRAEDAWSGEREPEQRDHRAGAPRHTQSRFIG